MVKKRPLAVVGSGGEEVEQDVVLVARHDEAADGQAHAARIVAGEDVAEIARGHAELDGVARLDRAGAQQLRVGGEVVHDLGHEAADVDGVGAREDDAGVGQARGQLRIGEDALHGALGVIEVAADAADGDVSRPPAWSSGAPARG